MTRRPPRLVVDGLLAPPARVRRTLQPRQPSTPVNVERKATDGIRVRGGTNSARTVRRATPWIECFRGLSSEHVFVHIGASTGRPAKDRHLAPAEIGFLVDALRGEVHRRHPKALSPNVALFFRIATPAPSAGLQPSVQLPWPLDRTVKLDAAALITRWLEEDDRADWFVGVEEFILGVELVEGSAHERARWNAARSRLLPPRARVRGRRAA